MVYVHLKFTILLYELCYTKGVREEFFKQKNAF